MAAKPVTITATTPHGTFSTRTVRPVSFVVVVEWTYTADHGKLHAPGTKLVGYTWTERMDTAAKHVRDAERRAHRGTRVLGVYPVDAPTVSASFAAEMDRLVSAPRDT